MSKTSGKIRILFVDRKNNSTSQLAEYFTKQMYGHDAYSAGPEHDIVDCDMLSVMYMIGEDMRQQVSKDFSNLELLPEDQHYDLVVYLRQDVYDEWAPRTPWQGKQVCVDLGTVKDYPATDDYELDEAYKQLIEKVRTWVKENMKDPMALLEGQ